MQELEGGPAEEAEFGDGSPREGRRYRRKNAGMFARQELYHGESEIFSVEGSDANNVVGLVLAEAVFGGGAKSTALKGQGRSLPVSVGALDGRRGAKLGGRRWWVSIWAVVCGSLRTQQWLIKALT